MIFSVTKSQNRLNNHVIIYRKRYSYNMLKQNKEKLEIYSNTILERLPFLKDLPKEFVDEFILKTDVLEFKNNTYTTIKNFSTNKMLIVAKGRMRHAIIHESGKIINLSILDANKFFITSKTYFQNEQDKLILSFDSDTTVLVLDLTTLYKSPYKLLILEFITYTLVDYSAYLTTVILRLVADNLSSRIAKFLIAESNRTNSKTIVLTHEKIAEYINSAREPVTRILGDFEKEDIIEMSYKKIEIVNFNKLLNKLDILK